MNLATAFADVATGTPDKAALFWAESEFTYRRLLAQTRLAASRLAREFGVREGDRVGLWLRNCPEFIPAFFGALTANAAVVPINNFLKPAEVSYILQDAGVDVVLVDESMKEHLPALRTARPQLKFLPVEEFATATETLDGAATPSSTRAEGHLAVIIYTSGTTGHPKGAMLSHANLLHNVKSIHLMLEVSERDCVAVVLPMFHSFMLTVGVITPLLIGASILLIKHLQSPKLIIQEILARQATVLPAVPQFFRALLSGAAPPQLPLRVCISGGAPLPRELLKEFNAKMPVPLIEGYGLSESSPVASFNPLHGPSKFGSIGLPIPDVEMSIQDENGQLLGTDQVGEVCIRGGNVMMGYWNQPEETARVLRQGWLLTGDVGYRDTDGFYYITDRKKDMLLVNGINVYPREIEEVMYQFPGVKEAAVVGMPDARKGEQPMAFYASKEGAHVDEKELHEFLRTRLADYKLPKQIVSLPALPRNSTGKILKTVLRQTKPAEAQ